MIRAELKSLDSLDLELDSFCPDRIDNFGIWLRAMVGPIGENSAESFDILVCTPDWIRDCYLEQEFAWGRHLLIVKEFDIQRIKAFISAYVNRQSGKSWAEVAVKVSRIGSWEYEDYQRP